MIVKFGIKLIIFLVIAVGGLYFFLPQIQKVAGDGSSSQTKNSSSKFSSNKSSSNKLSVSFYNGKPLPNKSSIIDSPQRSGTGKLLIINSSSGTDIVADLRESSNNQKTLASAFVKQGDRFTIENLPSSIVNIILTDVSNSQATTTKAIQTDKNYRITPYQLASGSGQVLMYRIQSSNK